MAFTSSLVALVGTGLSTVGAYQQAKAQKSQAEYNAAIATKNQELAEEQAAAQRREGYENMVKKRQEVAGVIASQRAAMGASGAQVDRGSFLDLELDTAEKGEIDALALYQRGLDAAYNTEVQGWNYGQQAKAYESQADNINPGWAAAGTAIGGLSAIGSNYGGSVTESGFASSVTSASRLTSKRRSISAKIRLRPVAPKNDGVPPPK